MLGLDLTNDNHFYHLVDTFADIQSDYRSDLATLPLCIDRMAEALDRFIAAYPADADDRIRTLVERVAAEILRSTLPDAYICTSSEVVNTIREYERFSTAAMRWRGRTGLLR